VQVTPAQALHIDPIESVEIEAVFSKAVQSIVWRDIFVARSFNTPQSLLGRMAIHSIASSDDFALTHKSP